MESSMPLQPGDIIIAVNRQGVTSVEQAQKAIKASKRDNVLLLIKRGRYNAFATVKK
jgi:type II secretory pathway component PulC